MGFFKPEDFEDSQGYKSYSSQVMAALANAKLEREGDLIWTDTMGKDHLWWTNPENKTVKNYKALLINIEPIEKCKHPMEKIKFNYIFDNGYGKGPSDTHLICECGAKVKPTSFEEVE